MAVSDLSVALRAGVLAVYTSAIGGAWSMVALALSHALSRRGRGAPPPPPDRTLLGTGFGLMMLGPTVLWTLSRLAAGLPSSAPRLWRSPPWEVILPDIAGGGLFALGWLLVGAGTRLGRSTGRGMAWAATAYLLVGGAWVLGVPEDPNIGVAEHVRNVLDPTAWLFALLKGLFWPGQVAAALGLLT